MEAGEAAGKNNEGVWAECDGREIQGMEAAGRGEYNWQRFKYMGMLVARRGEYASSCAGVLQAAQEDVLWTPGSTHY